MAMSLGAPIRPGAARPATRTVDENRVAGARAGAGPAAGRSTDSRRSRIIGVPRGLGRGEQSGSPTAECRHA